MVDFEESSKPMTKSVIFVFFVIPFASWCIGFAMGLGASQ